MLFVGKAGSKCIEDIYFLSQAWHSTFGWKKIILWKYWPMIKLESFQWLFCKFGVRCTSASLESLVILSCTLNMRMLLFMESPLTVIAVMILRDETAKSLKVGYVWSADQWIKSEHCWRPSTKYQITLYCRQWPIGKTKENDILTARRA